VLKTTISIVGAVLPTGEFNRGVTVLAGGTAIGQAIAILASPVLTRLYGPADFGVVAVYTSIVGIVGALAAFSYHQAIPLLEDDAEAAQALGVSMISTLVTTVMMAVVLAVVGGRFAVLLEAPALVPYLWMIPLGVMGLSSYEVLTQWAVRNKTFSAIAGTGVAKGITQAGTQLGLGVGGLAPFGLLFGQLIGQWTGSGSLLRQAIKDSRAALQTITPAGMRAAASRWQRFPRYTTPSVLVNVVGINAPPLLLSYYFGGAVTGLYALGSRVVMMPVSLVAKSVSQVFVASAPSYLREGRLGQEVELLFGRMLRLALAPVAILAIAAPAMFSVIFGAEWREAGAYVRWLSPWLLIVFVGFPLAPLVSVLERQKAGLVFQGSLTIMRVAALVAGGIIDHALIAVALFGAASGVCWAVFLLWLLRAGGSSFLAASRLFVDELLRSLVLLAPVAICVGLRAPPMITTGVAGLCGLVAVLSAIPREAAMAPHT
jgi:O-antigen/teichoic acid export membrane protein